MMKVMVEKRKLSSAKEVYKAYIEKMQKAEQKKKEKEK